MSAQCYRCGEPIDGHPIELVRHPDGERVEIHGTCLLKSYGADAYEEDKPDLWTHGNKSGTHAADLDLSTHIDELIAKENEPSGTYQRGRELMEAQR